MSQAKGPGRPKAAPKTDAETLAAREAAKAERKSGAAFVRLGTKRTKVVLKNIGLLGNLSVYPHKDAQAEAIVTALREAVEALAVKFAGSAQSSDGFTLPE